MLELLSSKLLHLLKILEQELEGSMEYVKRIAQDMLDLQSNAFALPCSVALSSAQDRLGWPSPAMLVEMGALFSV